MGSIGGVLFHHASKPVKRHDGRFYWLPCDVALVLARLCPPGRILGTQTFRAAGVFAFYLHSEYTHFSGGRDFVFYLHTLFGWSGFSHFTYTHVSGGRGLAFYLHTLVGGFLSRRKQYDA